MVVKMSLGAPPSAVADTSFGDKAVDVGIPFEVTAKGMEDTYEAGSKAFGFIVFAEHTEDDAAGGRKKAVKERPVREEKRAQLFGNGEDTVAVCDV